MNRRRIIAAVAIPVGLLVTLSACDLGGDKVSEPYRDAPRNASTNSRPATVVEMPDGFSNLATKCLSPGIRVTVVYKGDYTYGAVSTVPDPKC
jgi:hypothetical protein